MPSDFPFLKDAGDLRGSRVLLRLDADAPVDGGVLRDTYRIDSAERTLRFLKAQGAKTLIVGHIGRDQKETLLPVFTYLKQKLPIEFVPTVSAAREEMRVCKEGEFLLLENLRSFYGETENDPKFAQELASLADVYVSEAFAASHRAHASIVGVPKFLPSYAGFLFAEEVEKLSEAFSPPHPALVILGGAKFETKIPLIKKFLEIADTVYVSGALANDIYKARGYEIGASRVSGFVLPPSLLKNPRMRVPLDAVVKTKSGNEEKTADALARDDKIVDIGSGGITELRSLIGKAAFVLWSGPLGEYEFGYDTGTVAAARTIAESKAKSIIGGGDSLAVVSRIGLLEKFSFVSTGGGAMLEFLANGTLPGIEALQKAVIF